VDDHRPAMRLYFWLICMPISLAAVGPSCAADLSAVFSNGSLSLNGTVVGDVSDNRAKLSLPALVQALGSPDRGEVQGHTRRITWDNEGIQLEATDRESTPFGLLFEFAKPDTANQGIIPTGQYRGTFDCLGIKLYLGDQLPDRVKILTTAGFNREFSPSQAETWSLRLPHWAVFLRFSEAGSIDSAVIRVLPDIY
jgi:hypothetical protein